MARRGRSAAVQVNAPAPGGAPAEERRLERRSKVIKALAHPSRLAMVDALSRGERCVCELQELVGADMSTVSRHLALLRDAGVVSSDKRGLQVFYRLRVPCLLSFFSCVDAVFENPDADLVELPSPQGTTSSGCGGRSCAAPHRR